VFGDGAHFAGVEGDFLLERNDFGWNGDDSVNIIGLLIPVQVEASMGAAGSWLRVHEQWSGRASLLETGNKVLLFSRGLSELGEAATLAIEPSTYRLRISQLPTNDGNLIIARE
jgi:hypothetical protein